MKNDRSAKDYTDTLKDGPLSASDVAERLTLPIHQALNSLRALANLGIITQLPNERFALREPPSAEDNPAGTIAFLEKKFGLPDA